MRLRRIVLVGIVILAELAGVVIAWRAEVSARGSSLPRQNQEVLGRSGANEQREPGVVPMARKERPGGDGTERGHGTSHVARGSLGRGVVNQAVVQNPYTKKRVRVQVQAAEDDGRKKEEIFHFKEFWKTYHDMNVCIRCGVTDGRVRVCKPSQCTSYRKGQCYMCFAPKHERGMTCPILLHRKASYDHQCRFCLLSRGFHEGTGFNVCQQENDGKQGDILRKLVFLSRLHEPKTFREILGKMGYRSGPQNTKLLVRFLEDDASKVYGKGGTNYMRFASYWMRR